MSTLDRKLIAIYRGTARDTIDYRNQPGRDEDLREPLGERRDRGFRVLPAHQDQDDEEQEKWQ